MNIILRRGVILRGEYDPLQDTNKLKHEPNTEPVTKTKMLSGDL